MRCHYEVLGVSNKADFDAVKKAYRVLALKAHPDKAQQRGDDVEAATALFREIQAAFEVLGDADERAFYDANRETIIAGVDPEEEEEQARSEFDAYVFNPWPYFDRGAFADFDDSGFYNEEEEVEDGRARLFLKALRKVLERPYLCFLVFLVDWALVMVESKRTKQKGFYACFDAAFEELRAKEAAAAAANGEASAATWPSFGDSAAPWKNVNGFYAKMANFRSQRKFAEAEDEYDVEMLPSLKKRERREAELRIAKQRTAARRNYEDGIRRLASHLKRRDPRVAKFKEAERLRAQREAEVKEREAERKRDEFIAKRTAWLQEQHQEEEEEVLFTCEPCDRTFTSEALWERHLTSKPHSKRCAAAAAAAEEEAEEKQEQQAAAAVVAAAEEEEEEEQQQQQEEEKGEESSSHSHQNALRRRLDVAVDPPLHKTSEEQDSGDDDENKSPQAGGAVEVPEAGVADAAGHPGEVDALGAPDAADPGAAAPDAADASCFFCGVCEKSFGAAAALDKHLASRAHRAALKLERRSSTQPRPTSKIAI